MKDKIAWEARKEEAIGSAPNLLPKRPHADVGLLDSECSCL